MRKLRKKNERMNNLLYKSILVLFVLALLFISILKYGLPHHSFLQPMLLRYKIALILCTSGIILLFCSLLLLAFLTSRRSPLKSVQLRYQLLNFKREFLTSGVELYYRQTEVLKIELFCNGFIEDESRLGKQLSQYLRITLLHFEAQNAGTPACFILGEEVTRQNGMEELLNE